MRTLNREDVRKVLDRAGFNPDHVIYERHSENPGGETGVGLRINRSAIGRVAQVADEMFEEGSLNEALPTNDMSAAMQIDQAPGEYDIVYFPGFALSGQPERDTSSGDTPPDAADDPLGEWLSEHVPAEYLSIAGQIPRGLSADEVRDWLRRNDYDTPVALDLVDMAERAGVLGNRDAASGTSGDAEEDAAPESEAADAEGETEGDGIPSFLKELFGDGIKEIKAEDAPPEIRKLFESIKGLDGAVNALAGDLHVGPHGPGCYCTTEREERVADLATRYRRLAKREGDLKSVAMMDAILAELRA